MNFLKLLSSLENDGEINKTQAKIIVSAIEVFSEKGYSAATTSEIAKKAGIAEGTIFRYYKTKKDLLLAIPECLNKVSLIPLFIQDLNKVLENPGDNFGDFLRKFIMDRKDFANANLPILKVIFQEVPFHAELREKIINTIINPTMRKMVKIIDAFKEKGQISDIPSSTVVTLLFANIMGFLFTRYIAVPELSWKDDDFEYLIKYITSGLLNKQI